MKKTIAMMVIMVGGYTHASEFHGVTFTDQTPGPLNNTSTTPLLKHCRR